MGEVEAAIGGDGGGRAKKERKKRIYKYKHEEIIHNFEKENEEIRKKKME